MLADYRLGTDFRDLVLSNWPLAEQRLKLWNRRERRSDLPANLVILSLDHHLLTGCGRGNRARGDSCANCYTLFLAVSCILWVSTNGGDGPCKIGLKLTLDHQRSRLS